MTANHPLQADILNFRTLVDNALDAIIMADLEANVIYANRAAHQMFGCDYEKKEMVDTSATRYWRAEDLPFLKGTVMPQAAAGGWEGEVMQQRVDGSLFVGQAGVWPLQNEQGQMVSVGVFVRDITAIKQAETAVRETIYQQSQILDGLYQFITVLDSNGIIMRINRAAVDSSGLRAEDLLGKPFWQGPWWQISEAVQERLKQAIHDAARGEFVRYEVEVLSASGIITVDFSLNPVCNEQGQAVQMLAEGRNITDLKRIEQKVRQSEIKYRNLIETTDTGFVVLDGRGNVIDANPTYIRMTGRQSLDEILGHCVTEWTADYEIERNAQAVQKCLEQGYIHNLEIDYVDQTGKATSVEISASVSKTDPEIEVLSLIRDITERRQAEAERTRLQEQVIEAQRHALQELSTPIIPLMDRIIIMPLIGSVDSLRAKDITRALLAGINQYRAKILIMDITGVPLVDSGVADHLNKTIQAARLKGTQTIVTGISDAVAEAIVDLGIDWSNIQTLSDLQTGLVTALNLLGLKLVRQQ